jgi:hypothetical protein
MVYVLPADHLVAASWSSAQLRVGRWAESAA